MIYVLSKIMTFFSVQKGTHQWVGFNTGRHSSVSHGLIQIRGRSSVSRGLIQIRGRSPVSHGLVQIREHLSVNHGQV